MTDDPRVYTSDMTLFGKLFPETLFPRKLSADAEQRLRISQARAEEALVRTHVENALLFVERLRPTWATNAPSTSMCVSWACPIRWRRWSPHARWSRWAKR